MVDPVDYHVLLKHPDRDEPENSDFTSFTGKITEGDVLSLPEKGGLESRTSGMRTTSQIHNWSASRHSPNGRRAD